MDAIALRARGEMIHFEGETWGWGGEEEKGEKTAAERALFSSAWCSYPLDAARIFVFAAGEF